MSARTKGIDWLDAGLALLRDGGDEALTIERLCAALGRTKGSFYHHFTDIAAYHQALLGRWSDLHTEHPIVEATGSAAKLYRAVSKVDFGLELAVHAWAVRSPTARKAADRVHARRIKYLTRLHRSKAKAELEYAAFVGSMHVFAGNPAARQRIHGAITRLLSAPA